MADHLTNGHKMSTHECCNKKGQKNALGLANCDSHKMQLRRKKMKKNKKLRKRIANRGTGTTIISAAEKNHAKAKRRDDDQSKIDRKYRGC